MDSAAGRRARALLAAGAAAGLLVGCTATVVSGRGRAEPSASQGSAGSTVAPGHSPGATASRANFGACAGSGVDLGSTGSPSGFQVGCATISVPLDYSKPTGRQISVALVRLHRDGASTKASLLVDPGGPGGSGVQFATEIAGALPDSITSHFDLVGFDPRGVGSSTPIHCLTDKQKDQLNAAQPDVRTAAGFAEAKRLAHQVATACTAKFGDSLAQFNTVQTAKDMDRIRQALGDAQLTYLGFSYGTELGAQYAHLFPSKVRALVLDGAVDPLTDEVTSFADQLEGFEQAFDQFATWCGQHTECSVLGSPRPVVYRLAAQARTAPLHSADPSETRVATSAIVDLAVLSALYSQQLWPVLAQALISAQGGDARGLFQLADLYTERKNGHYTNVTDAYDTIFCNDNPPGPSDATIRATNASWIKRFPMFGLWSGGAPSAGPLVACQQWQPKRTVPEKPTAPTAAHKILVIGNLHDPATPYQGAKDLTATLGNAVMLTWDGEGHTSFLQGSSCIDDTVAAYLVDGTVPPAGKTCPR